MRSNLATRTIAAVFVLLGAGAAAVLCVGWQLSRPVPAEIGPPPRDLNADALTFQSESGSLIHGWLSHSENDRGAVLLLPGVRENRLTMVDRARALRAAGYSTLL